MNLDEYTTEQRNANSMNLHAMSTEQILKTMNDEDQKVAFVVQALVPQITKAVDAIVERLERGGRLFYVGSGTSGRLGMLDASECPPTFMTSHELVQTVMAGGNTAFFEAVENAEDDAVQGAKDLQARGVDANDVVIGITASGRTPYPIGAVQYARRVGAFTISLTCNAHAEISEETDLALEAVVGPEVLTGSTRLKSGTAHKLILNMLSTATMVKLGKVYENLMVDVHASNEKLVQRAIRIVQEITHCTLQEAMNALQQHDFHVKRAILAIETNAAADDIDEALREAKGFIERAKTLLQSR